MGRIAPEASAGFPLDHEEPRGFPSEEAGGVFPAPFTKKSAPYDSNPAEAGPDPRAMESLGPCALPLFKGLKCYEHHNFFIFEAAFRFALESR